MTGLYFQVPPCSIVWFEGGTVFLVLIKSWPFPSLPIEKLQQKLINLLSTLPSETELHTPCANAPISKDDVGFVEYLLPFCYLMVHCSDFCDLSLSYVTRPSRVRGIELQKACRSQSFGKPWSKHACVPWTEEAFRLIITYAWTFGKRRAEAMPIWTVKQQEREESHAHALKLEMRTVCICRKDLQSSKSPERHGIKQNSVNTSSSSPQG